MLWPAVTATPDSVRLPAPGMVVIFTAESALAGAVVRIGEAEVGRGEGVRVSSQVVTVLFGAGRRIVDRRHVRP